MRVEDERVVVLRNGTVQGEGEESKAAETLWVSGLHEEAPNPRPGLATRMADVISIYSQQTSLRRQNAVKMVPPTHSIQKAPACNHLLHTERGS